MKCIDKPSLSAHYASLRRRLMLISIDIGGITVEMAGGPSVAEHLLLTFLIVFSSYFII